MEPRCEHRGERAQCASSHPPARGFNGAAVRTPRRGDSDYRARQGDGASMEPRCEHRGEPICAARPCPARACFNGAAVRTPRRDSARAVSPRSRARFNGAAVRTPRRGSGPAARAGHVGASMEPRCEHRGELSCPGTARGGTPASMEPRCEHRGERGDDVTLCPAYDETLQWSRGANTAALRANVG